MTRSKEDYVGTNKWVHAYLQRNGAARELFGFFEFVTVLVTEAPLTRPEHKAVRLHPPKKDKRER